jgi:anti-anti-sigma factor
MNRHAAITVSRQDDSVAVVALEGEHDLASAQEATRVFERLVAEGTGVVVDLSRTTFVDTTTVHALVVGRRLAGEAGVRFVVSLPESHVARRVLALMRVLDVLPASSDLEEAIELAREPPAARGRAGGSSADAEQRSRSG